MPVQYLTSRENALLKTFRLVSSGAHRAPEDLVVAEGIRVLEEAADSGSEVVAAVFSEGFGSEPRERALLDCWLQKKVRLYTVKGSLFQSISGVQSPQGAAALVRVPRTSLSSVPPARNAMILYACGIQDPGNLGTLIRTAAAAGASLVCTTKGTVAARNAKVIRSSAGAFFRVPVVEQTDLGEFRRYCAHHSIQVYRTDASHGVIYTEADLKSPCALLLGNEGGGMPGEEFGIFPALRIPLAEGIESLNVAVAGAVILFEARRQRLTKL